MRAQYASLKGAFSSNQFQRQLYLESDERAGDVRGNVYAVLDQPFKTVNTALHSSKNWCDILILHLNVKGCSVSQTPAGDVVSINIGRKYDQPLADAHRIDFFHKVVGAHPDYLHVTLSAEDGPLGTRDYRILLEVAPLDVRRSFLHFSYAYSYNLASRVAVNGYLATAGRDKVGFTVVDRTPEGRPVYTRKMRGVVERNAMRYFLAIEAYLSALSAPPSEQLEKRLQGWFTAIERYPLQLHELERGEYVAMKRKEVLRQQDAKDTLIR